MTTSISRFAPALIGLAALAGLAVTACGASPDGAQGSVNEGTAEVAPALSPASGPEPNPWRHPTQQAAAGGTASPGHRADPTAPLPWVRGEVEGTEAAGKPAPESHAGEDSIRAGGCINSVCNNSCRACGARGGSCTAQGNCLCQGLCM